MAAKLEQALVFIVIVVFALWAAGAFHVIDSGHIGVYKRGGAVLNTWTQPGLHFMIPFITRYHQVQVTLQTDQVTDIPCGTSSGVILKFRSVEVVNRLNKQLAHDTIKNYTVTYDQTWIFSKIHHEINQFCSSHTVQEVLIDKFSNLDESLKESLQEGCNKWAPGIEIIAVRVTKPSVPQSIARNYEERQVERTKLLIRKQEQKLREKESQIEKRVSRVTAETSNIISEISNRINFATKEANQKIASIENEIVTLREAAYAKAKLCKIETMVDRQGKMIELNKQKLIPQKVLANTLTNIKNANKTVYSKSLQAYLDTSSTLLKSVNVNLK